MKLFVLKENIVSDTITVSGEDAMHLSVSLRCRAGEKIKACDECGVEYDCEIEKITKNDVTLKILDTYECRSEMQVRVHLFQALPKGDKAEFIIQKAVETGVYDITFVESERCVAKFNDKALQKVERFRKIAKAAAEQSGRGIVPNVNIPMTFENAVKIVDENALNVFCYEGDGTVSLKKIFSERTDAKDINVFIGPEGGWSENEYQLAKDCGFYGANLGSRILRCETAAVFALCCVVYEFEL